jgi:hypothetical protein
VVEVVAPFDCNGLAEMKIHESLTVGCQVVKETRRQAGQQGDLLPTFVDTNATSKLKSTQFTFSTLCQSSTSIKLFYLSLIYYMGRLQFFKTLIEKKVQLSSIKRRICMQSESQFSIYISVI